MHINSLEMRQIQRRHQIPTQHRKPLVSYHHHRHQYRPGIGYPRHHLHKPRRHIGRIHGRPSILLKRLGTEGLLKVVVARQLKHQPHELRERLLEALLDERDIVSSELEVVAVYLAGDGRVPEEEELGELEVRGLPAVDPAAAVL